MGEMTDHFLDAEMAHPDFRGDHSYPDRPRERGNITQYKICKHCGANGLLWLNEGTQNSPQWRLYHPMNGKHSCEERDNTKNTLAKAMKEAKSQHNKTVVAKESTDIRKAHFVAMLTVLVVPGLVDHEWERIEVLDKNIITIRGNFDVESYYSECMDNAQTCDYLPEDILAKAEADTKERVYRLVLAVTCGSSVDYWGEYDCWEEYELISSYEYDDEEFRFVIQMYHEEDPHNEQLTRLTTSC